MKDSDDLSAIENFCNESIKITKDLYNVNVIFLIHDGIYNLKNKSVVSDVKYVRLKSFSVLISALKNVRFSDDSTNLNNIQNYFQTLKDLEQKITSKKLKVSEATEELFDLIENESLTFNENILHTIGKNLSALFLAANYFNPKYYGHHFRDDETLFEKLETFLQNTAPIEAFDFIGYYHNKNGPFNKLFENTDDLDVIRFWSGAKMFCKPFSQYAINLLSISTFSPQIDMKSLLAKFSMYRDASPRFRTLIVDTLLTEI